jgi:hypothetical protein
MSGPILSRIMAFGGGVVAIAALATAHCQAKTYINCTGLCENVLPCNDSYDECIAFCTAQEDKCERVGHPAAFLAYVSCATDAGFSCNDAGEPLANAPCGPQQAELVQCESDDDATLAIPDGAYDAAAECVDAGSCLSCCAAAYPLGAKEYAEATKACVCSTACVCLDTEGGQHSCQSQCGEEICAPQSISPESGDACDQCLSTVLDEQTPDAGVCVLSITEECNSNKNPDCPLYVNCVSQVGCTN